jgi:NADPH-dependent 2,4-dienoyl-CoA reductase/sulfur reductase-like enzyme
MKLNATIKALDPAAKTVHDAKGETHTFGKLLLATGGTPRQLPVEEHGSSIIYFRTLSDYRLLRDLSERGQRFVVIGGGFIGSEIAAALAMNGKEVIQFFPDAGLGAAVYPPDISKALVDYYRTKGVQVYPGEKFGGIGKQGERLVVKTDSGQSFLVDGVVAGIGIRPNVELAQAAGLKVENGIVVDETLRSSHPDIFAAGDVASFSNPVLGKQMRVEHEDNALMMGDRAGRNMAGETGSYHHLPYFYSDLFDLGYEAVGELDSRMETFVDWQEPYQKGVIYYLREGCVRGVLLWNVWDQVEAARRLIAEPGPFAAETLKGRLPESA